LVDGEVTKVYITFPQAKYLGAVITGLLAEICAYQSRMRDRTSAAGQVEVNVLLVERTQPA
jgi:hypothetical protein